LKERGGGYPVVPAGQATEHGEEGVISVLPLLEGRGMKNIKY
jgi:hypothetical protein